MNKNKIVQHILWAILAIFGAFALSNIAGAQGAIDIPDGVVGVIQPPKGGDASSQIQNLIISAIQTAKVIIIGIGLIYVVYLGIQMVIAMGQEDKIKKSKTQLGYLIIAFLFINIPGTLVRVFSPDAGSAERIDNAAFRDTNSTNMFINLENWNTTIVGGVVAFIEVLIFFFAIISIIQAGYYLLFSSGSDDAKGKAKNKFIYTLFALLAVGIFESWTRFAWEGSIEKGKDIFEQLANLALYFAGPVAIFFLILAAFYYITSAGNDDKVKTAKNIVINTAIATIILLASYTFLNDLANLTI